MEYSTFFVVAILFLTVLFSQGMVIVPAKEEWVAERFGRFSRVLKSGINFIIPFVERIAYKHSTKDIDIKLTKQSIVTSDNLTFTVDGVLRMRIVDSAAASYGVSNLLEAVRSVLKTAIRSEFGNMSSGKIHKEVESSAYNINMVLNTALKAWGVKSERFDITDVVRLD